MFDEDRGLVNQRSTQTKSSQPTALIKKEDANNPICKICEKLLMYFAVNGFKIKLDRKLYNFLLQQIQNGLDVIVIPLSFFKHDRQLWIWILQTSATNLEIHLKVVLGEQFGKRLSNFQNKCVEKQMNYNVDEDDNNTSEQKTHQQSKKIKEVTVNKYSENRKGDLYESVLIDNVHYF